MALQEEKAQEAVQDLDAHGPCQFHEALVTPAWVAELMRRVEVASWGDSAAVRELLPAEMVCRLFDRLATALKQEPTLVEVSPLYICKMHELMASRASQLLRAGWPAPRDCI